MSKFFEKHETMCLIFLIAGYVIINSYCMQNFGFTSPVSFIANTILSVVLLALIVISKKAEYYGLRKVENAKGFLYFIPLIIISTIGLWNGIDINHTSSEIIFHILTMINVGFLEEIIFRGILYKSMEKDNKRSAIIISSITFGIGHIVNLLNGADLIPTFMQICYATAIGFLFVTIFDKSKSLIPCIIAHIVINSLSIIGKDTTGISFYLISIILIVVSISYTIFIVKSSAMLDKMGKSCSHE